MNSESFSEYLKNPSKLYQINYQELKSLALQYPYCQNLQWLLLQKSKMDGNKEADTLLARTATGSMDRALLYKKMKAIAAIHNSTSDLTLLDEVLELPTLANFRRPEPILIETHPTAEEPILAQQSFDAFKPALPKEEELDFSKLQIPPRPTELPEIMPEPGIIEPLTTPEIPVQDDPIPSVPEQFPEVPDPVDPGPTLPELPDEGEEMEAQTSNAFEWDVSPSVLMATPIEQPSAVKDQSNGISLSVSHAKMYQPPKLQIKLPPKPALVNNKEAQAASLAAKSVEEKQEVASETLALILARQGHREKAMRMYEQLILKIPEKSAYFAAQIQKLKQA